MTLKKENILPCIEIASSRPAKYSLIWLHGLGADGNDFVPMVDQLGLAAEIGIRFIFPHAPVMPVSINNGFAMRAWYDIRSLTRLDDIDMPGIKRSVAAIEALITAEIARGIPREHIFLGGFSQGAAIALCTALSHSAPLQGVIAFSGYLPLMSLLHEKNQAAIKKMPIFIAHGSEDNIVPYALGLQAYQALDQAGYQASMHTYPIAHSVCESEIADLRRWLKMQIS